MVSPLMRWSQALVLFFLVLLSAGVGKAWHGVRDGFRLDRCNSLKALSGFHASTPSPEVARALTQPFRYLAAGRQCYAFESADGQYVLKLPRTDRCRKTPEATEFFARSVALALETLANETGLEAVTWSGSVTLIDRLGRSHRLAPRSVYLVQPKKQMLFESLEAALAMGDRERALEMLDALLALLSSLNEKGVACKDLSFARNVGYDGRNASCIDVGMFCLKTEWSGSSLTQLRAWLQRKDSEVLRLFDEKVKRLG